MREYVWVIIAVVAILLFIAICIAIGVFFWRMYRYRPRRVVRVSPTAAKPIQPIQTIESQYSNYTNYLNNNENSYYPVGQQRAESLPYKTTVLRSENRVKRESLGSLYNRNWASTSIQSNSIDIDEPPKRPPSRQKRHSKEFIDRDPPTEESRSDFLNPLDFENIQEIYSNSEISYERKQPMTNIECTYREDHRYFCNNDRLV